MGFLRQITRLWCQKLFCADLLLSGQCWFSDRNRRRSSIFNVGNTLRQSKFAVWYEAFTFMNHWLYGFLSSIIKQSKALYIRVKTRASINFTKIFFACRVEDCLCIRNFGRNKARKIMRSCVFIPCMDRCFTLLLALL